MGEAIRNDELRASTEQHFVTPRRDSVLNMLERRRTAGDIRDDVDIDLVGPIPSAIFLPAPTHHPRACCRHPPERIVDERLLPLLT